MGSNRRQYDSGNPLQPGNALKNKNFDEAVFRYLLVAVLILLMLAACAHYIYAFEAAVAFIEALLLTEDRRNVMVPNHSDVDRSVLIVGGAFAGLACALELADVYKVSVMLIDRHNYDAKIALGARPSSSK